MSKICEKVYLEEYARQVLEDFFPKKYEGSVLKDKPDIQNEKNSVGVEVTGALLENVRYGIAQFTELRGKKVSTLSIKKREQLNKKDVFYKEDTSGNIAYIGPAAVWGSGNDVKGAYDKKTKKLHGANFRLFAENNLFIFAEFEEEDDISDFVNFLHKEEKHEPSFDHIYMFTFRDIYTITRNMELFCQKVETERKNLYKSRAIELATM